MAVADSAGLPIAVSIAKGSRHDVVLVLTDPPGARLASRVVTRLCALRKVVDQTLDEAVTEHLPSKLIADKAFDSADLARRLRAERNIELIAPKRSRSHRRRQDGRPMRRYKRRWKVERLFGWLKRFRRIVVRWEANAQNYLGFLQLGCAAILLRQF